MRIPKNCLGSTQQYERCLPLSGVEPGKVGQWVAEHGCQCGAVPSEWRIEFLARKKCRMASPWMTVLGNVWLWTNILHLFSGRKRDVSHDFVEASVKCLKCQDVWSHTFEVVGCTKRRARGTYTNLCRKLNSANWPSFTPRRLSFADLNRLYEELDLRDYGYGDCADWAARFYQQAVDRDTESTFVAGAAPSNPGSHMCSCLNRHETRSYPCSRFLQPGGCRFGSRCGYCHVCTSRSSTRQRTRMTHQQCLGPQSLEMPKQAHVAWLLTPLAQKGESDGPCDLGLCAYSHSRLEHELKLAENQSLLSFLEEARECFDTRPLQGEVPCVSFGILCGSYSGMIQVHLPKTGAKCADTDPRAAECLFCCKLAQLPLGMRAVTVSDAIFRSDIAGYNTRLGFLRRAAAIMKEFSCGQYVVAEFLAAVAICIEDAVYRRLEGDSRQPLLALSGFLGRDTWSGEDSSWTIALQETWRQACGVALSAGCIQLELAFRLHCFALHRVILKFTSTKDEDKKQIKEQLEKLPGFLKGARYPLSLLGHWDTGAKTTWLAPQEEAVATYFFADLVASVTGIVTAWMYAEMALSNSVSGEETANLGSEHRS